MMNLANSSSNVISILQQKGFEYLKDELKNSPKPKVANNWHMKKSPRKSLKLIKKVDRYYTQESQNTDHCSSSKNTLTDKSKRIFNKHRKTGLKLGEIFDEITKSDL
jgi:hypothetical protein